MWGGAGSRTGVALVLALLGTGADPTAGQATGNVAGTVLDAVSTRPVSGAAVLIPGTVLNTVTDERGRFLLLDVPAGERTVRVQRMGYRSATQTVDVRAGRTASLLFRVAQAAVELDELVVAGVIGATPQAKLAFDVDKVTTEGLPVWSADPAALLSGRIAGARVLSGSGQPGEEMDILLRGAHAINAKGRSQSPLIIVDGVITTGGLTDIEAQDVESIEVVKGAAAASLYGSRAGNGVVQIATKRGRNLGGNRVRYTVRSEYGASDLAGTIDLSDSHPYAMNATRTRFLDRFGNEFDYEQTGYELWLAGNSAWSTFQENPWPGPRYDHVRRVFTAGEYLSNYVSLEGASGRTNFFLSAATLQETGVVRFNDGYERTTFRLNMDHGLNDRLRISGSAAYGLTEQDELEDGGGAFFDLTFMPPFANLLETTPDGQVILVPDPREAYPNPLYGVQNRDITDKTSRIMGSVLVRYQPTGWLDLAANVSYDRKDWERTDYLPRGYKTLTPSSINDGQLSESSYVDHALNGSLTASAYRNVDDLTLRTKLRYLYEDQRYELYDAFGRRTAVETVPDLSEVATAGDVESVTEDVQSHGYFLIAGLDYGDRFIVDALVRRDGSSLFGVNHRWQTYYRGSLAWRIAREDWWSIPAVSDLKVRYSVGTAGGRPRFEAQYETYDVASGSVAPVQYGNPDLKPEYITEHEAGLDVALYDRVSLGLTYAKSIAADQLDEVTLPGYAGFGYQWKNIGTLEGSTWEASLEASLIEARDTRWEAHILFDRTRSVITELNMPCYTWGMDEQTLGDLFYNCDGVEFGTIYGTRFATSCQDLPAGTPCEPFTVNADGYLVYVGDHGPGQGLSPAPDDPGRILWETTDTVNGTAYHWGAPIAATGTDRRGEPTRFLPLGNVMPDFSLAVSSDFSWRGLNVFALFDASIGLDIYNRTRQSAAARYRAGEMDQRGVPDGEKKPVAYYQALYDGGSVNSHYVEDGSFVKLREVALRYTLQRDQLDFMPIPMDRLTVSLIGRNVATWTEYSGYDPEVGWVTGGQAGSAVINRLDAHAYPKFRTLTGAVEIVF